MKKLLLILLLICPFVINGCSCDKFDINTYESAVKNYKNSTGVHYKLTVTTKTEGEGDYTLKESVNKYIFSTTKEVESFSSQLTEYKVISSEYGANSAPQSVYTLNRYYKKENNTFYTNEKTQNSDNKLKENISYEEKYDEDSEYNIYNIVPAFDIKNISNFNIVKDKKNKGYSIATFDASCPSVLVCSNETKITYTVKINKNFNFDTIEFTVVNGAKTSEYKYVFYKYNSDVEITFPSDLVNY